MQGLNKEHDWKNATIMASASAAAYKNLGNIYFTQKEYELRGFGVTVG